jgi:hypothetical protein
LGILALGPKWVQAVLHQSPLLESPARVGLIAESPPNPTVGDGHGPPCAMTSWRREIGFPKQEALADWSCSGVSGLISALIMSVFSFNAFSHIHTS